MSTHFASLGAHVTLVLGIDEIGQLLALWHDRSRSSADVKALAMARAAELQRKAKALDASACCRAPCRLFVMATIAPIARSLTTWDRLTCDPSIAIRPKGPYTWLWTSHRLFAFFIALSLMFGPLVMDRAMAAMPASDHSQMVRGGHCDPADEKPKGKGCNQVMLRGDVRGRDGCVAAESKPASLFLIVLRQLPRSQAFTEAFSARYPRPLHDFRKIELNSSILRRRT